MDKLTKSISKIHPQLRQLIFILLATLPVLAYVWNASVIHHNGIFGNEDWDYFMQLYEAARINILQYHQFPWWNSWTMGGIPLFANPQFGLISLQMPLVLIWGTVTGLHLSLILYFVFGFWGMFLLLKRLGANSTLLQILLSYLFVFSGYVSWHLGYGHLTFGNYLLAPWFFLTLLNIREKNGWIWFSLAAAFLINQAPHYSMVQMLCIGFCVAIYQIIIYCKTQPRWIIVIRPYLWSASLLVLLAGPKLLYCFQYLHNYARFIFVEPAVPFGITWAAITARHAVILHQFHAPVYAWQEYADYFGLITLLLFATLLIIDFSRFREITSRKWVLLGAIVLAFLVTLGAGFPFAPYPLLHELPLFREMRVPSRWIGWFSFGVILYLAWLPKKPIIYFLLALSVIDVAYVNYPALNVPQTNYQPPVKNVNFQQYASYDYYPGKATYRLLKATQANRGDVYGYEPILFFAGDYQPEFVSSTDRCGINQGCNFILTKNAKVIYWSPLKVLLQRTGKGNIKLNMNPGYDWSVNGKAIFSNERILELKKPFLIIDPAQHITVKYRPIP